MMRVASRAVTEGQQTPAASPSLTILTQTSFYQLVLAEDWVKGMRKIKCACLEPTGDRKMFTVDPKWKGDSEKSEDKAFIALIFEIGGEALRPVPGGLETPDGTVPAWKLVLRG